MQWFRVRVFTWSSRLHSNLTNSTEKRFRVIVETAKATAESSEKEIEPSCIDVAEKIFKPKLKNIH